MVTGPLSTAPSGTIRERDLAAAVMRRNGALQVDAIEADTLDEGGVGLQSSNPEGLPLAAGDVRQGEVHRTSCRQSPGGGMTIATEVAQGRARTRRSSLTSHESPWVGCKVGEARRRISSPICLAVGGSMSICEWLRFILGGVLPNRRMRRRHDARGGAGSNCVAVLCGKGDEAVGFALSATNVLIIEHEHAHYPPGACSLFALSAPNRTLSLTKPASAE